MAFSDLAMHVRIPCPREEGYCLDHIRELGLINERGLLDRIVCVDIEGENSPRDGREIGTYCSFDSGKVLGVESRDDATARRVTM